MFHIVASHTLTSDNQPISTIFRNQLKTRLHQSWHLCVIQMPYCFDTSKMPCNNPFILPGTTTTMNEIKFVLTKKTIKPGNFIANENKILKCNSSSRGQV